MIDYNEYDIEAFRNLLGGIAPSTVSKWCSDFGIDIKKDRNNKRIFTDTDLKIFKRIVELKERNIHIHDIQDILKKEFDINNEDTLPATVSTVNDKLEEFWRQLEDRDAARDEKVIKAINARADAENYLIKKLAETEAENEKLKKELAESKKGFFRGIFR